MSAMYLWYHYYYIFRFPKYAGKFNACKIATQSFPVSQELRYHHGYEVKDYPRDWHANVCTKHLTLPQNCCLHLILKQSGILGILICKSMLFSLTHAMGTHWRVTVYLLLHRVLFCLLFKLEFWSLFRSSFIFIPLHFCCLEKKNLNSVWHPCTHPLYLM